MTQSAEWANLLEAPRHRSAELARVSILSAPGIYAWFSNGTCVYVGKAGDLRRRLSSHRSTSRDLSRSTLRASVAVQELGVSRAHARARPTLMTDDQVAVVNGWLAACEIAWLECPSPEDADALERRLRSEWMPPLNRV